MVTTTIEEGGISDGIAIKGTAKYYIAIRVSDYFGIEFTTENENSNGDEDGDGGGIGWRNLGFIGVVDGQLSED